MAEELELEVLADGCIQVTLRRGNRCAKATVSSFHLVEDKRRWLEAALEREADR